mmetsp:Transcript_44729/g.97281  ORF Transcript_44729/g.97281 Transcript_44729/m.97281 type:complete len:89 (-) Transcript_44729:1492-1758(-)
MSNAAGEENTDTNTGSRFKQITVDGLRLCVMDIARRVVHTVNPIYFVGRDRSSVKMVVNASLGCAKIGKMPLVVIGKHLELVSQNLLN